MPRESTEEKAVRYLTEGRVRVQTVTAGTAWATVTGSTDYQVKRVGPTWTCTCPARVSPCAHVLAVSRVVPAEDTAPHILPEPDDDLDALLAVTPERYDQSEEWDV